jgi:hypothetical protein
MNTKKQTLVDLFELDKVPPEKAAEMADRLGKLVFQAVLVRVLPTLSKENMAEYSHIVGSSSDGEAVFKFLNEKVPNLKGIIKDETEKLQSELTQEFKKAGV